MTKAKVVIDIITWSQKRDYKKSTMRGYKKRLKEKYKFSKGLIKELTPRQAYYICVTLDNMKIFHEAEIRKLSKGTDT